MRIPARFWMMTCAALVLGALMSIPPAAPAVAQFGISIGGFPLGIHFGGRHRWGGRHGRRHNRGGGESSEKDVDDSRPGKTERVTVSKSAPSSTQQMEVLHDKVIKTALAPAPGA